MRFNLGATIFSAGVALASTAMAAPLTPIIEGHDINFGAYNSGGAYEWLTNGAAADTLVFTKGAVGTGGAPDREATAYWPAWPAGPVYPIFDETGMLTFDHFGGDFVLDVMFEGQDAPFVNGGGVSIDVSLTGTGGKTAPGAADLEIYGMVPGLSATPALLWAIDLKDVSLYGYSKGAWTPSGSSYVLEGVGTIVGGVLAQLGQVVGETGVMRGNLDFQENWVPSLYHPLQSPEQAEYRAAYSGETGLGSNAVPEPATMVVLAGGMILGLWTRRSRSV